MKTQLEKQSLQNSANNFGIEVHEYFTQDQRKKQRYFLVKNGTSVSPVYDYNEMNCFLNGFYHCVRHKIHETSVNIDNPISQAMLK